MAIYRKPRNRLPHSDQKNMRRKRIKIKSINDVCYVTKKWKYCREENFLVVTLDCSHFVIKVHHVTKGLLNKTIIHPRECFYPAIHDYALSVVLVHNHPSGNARPTDEDDNITARLCAAGNILGIHVLDHVIITPGKYRYSYKADGKLKENFTPSETIKLCFSGGER
jgi:DNA repair protein RadC